MKTIRKNTVVKFEYKVGNKIEEITTKVIKKTYDSALVYVPMIYENGERHMIDVYVDINKMTVVK